jgi:plasmid stabilization system protein ParE
MTRYTVVWAAAAQGELTEIWINARDRNEVTAAVRALDHQLAGDAPLQGADVSEGLRALVVPPLKVLFAVREADRIVEVLLVRRL